MVDQTDNYKLEQFGRGGIYSAASDYRRFVTLDNNLGSFVGLIGGGIIYGWEIEKVDANIVKILPGGGLSGEGFSMESSYTIKKRSKLEKGEREVDIIKYNNEIEKFLTEEQKDNYIDAVRDYDPSFNPQGEIENSYIKVVVPTELTLPVNQDTYIYAQKITDLPYPPLNDYINLGIEEPDINAFENFQDYANELEVYNNTLEIIKSYNWQLNPDNHFTASKFVFSSSKLNIGILLGKVIVRNGDVTKIDRKEVNLLYQLQAPIRNLAKDLISSHKHGGNKIFDPAKIELSSFIRKATFSYYDENNERVVYRLLNQTPTSTSLNHRHSFYVNEEGNGYTVDVLGNYPPHFHRIENFEVLNVEETKAIVPSHIHQIINLNEDGTIDDPLFSDDLEYEVFKNGELIDSNQSKLIPHKNILKLNKKLLPEIKVTQKLYSIDFIRDDYRKGDFDFFDSTFRYSAWSTSLSLFFLKAELAHKAHVKYLAVPNFIEEGKFEQAFALDSIIRGFNPFIISERSDDGEISVGGITSMIQQSEIGDKFLQEVGDEFLFTSPAARNVNVRLLDIINKQNASQLDEITVKVSNEQEVDNSVFLDNILYFHADKILFGKFQPVQVPQISHEGRPLEQALPLKQNLIAQNGLSYSVIPSRTRVNEGHYHFINVDSTLNGSTATTNTSNNISFTEKTENGNIYNIDHVHKISNGKVQESSSESFNNWRNEVEEVNEGDQDRNESHSHELRNIFSNPSFIVYSIDSNSSGDLFLGTSNGFVMVPQDNLYEISIDGNIFNLWLSSEKSLLKNFSAIKAKYEREYALKMIHTRKAFEESLEEQENLLNSHNDAISFSFSSASKEETIIITKKDYHVFDEFSSELRIPSIEKRNDDIILEYYYIRKENNLEFDPQTKFGQELIEDEDFYIEYLVERKVPAAPFINVIVEEGDSEDIYLLNPNIVIKLSDIKKNLNQKVLMARNNLDNIGLKRIYLTENDIWVCSNIGLYRSTKSDLFFSYQESLGDLNINDLIEFEGNIFVATNFGVFSSSNRGGSWSLETQNNATQLFKNNSLVYALEDDRIIYKDISNWKTHLKISPELDIKESILVSGEFYSITNLGYIKIGDNSYSVLSSELYESIQPTSIYGILLGKQGDVLYTDDNLSFMSLYTWEKVGGAFLFPNLSSNRMFYHEKNKTLFFQNLFLTNDESYTLVNYDKYSLENGKWDDDSKVKVYKDGTLMDESQYNLIPQFGEIEFGKYSKSEKDLKFASSTIFLEDISGFTVGDLIYVSSQFELKPVEFPFESPNDPNITNEQLIKYLDDLKEFEKQQNRLKKMEAWAKILSINEKSIVIDYVAPLTFLAPLQIQKIPLLNKDSIVNVSIDEDQILNSGELSHNEIENSLSIKNDFKPFKFSNVYQNNLLELAQSAKYAYPNSVSNLRNALFYDMHYKSIEELEGEIDTQQNAIYNETLFSVDGSPSQSSIITSIFIPGGVFGNKIYVGTSLGLFSSTIENANGLIIEKNWKFEPQIAEYVNDINSAPSSSSNAFDSLIVATNSGIYFSDDEENWTLIPVGFQPTKFSKRFLPENKNITIPSHSASWRTVEQDGQSYSIIQADNGTYELLNVNRTVAVDIGGGNSKSLHSLVDINKYFDWIKISPPIEPEGSSNNVVVVEDRWWQSFDELGSSSNDTYINPLLVGGNGRMGYSLAKPPTSWDEASINSRSTSFVSSSIQALDDGSIVTTINSLISSSIHYATNFGSTWILEFEKRKQSGRIINVSLSSLNNSILEINWDGNFNSIINELYNYSYIIRSNNIIIDSGKIFNNFENTLTVFSRNFFDKYNETDFFYIEIFPYEFYDIVEHKSSLFLTTENGILTDSGSYFKENLHEGLIDSIAMKGFVEKVNKKAKILSYRTEGDGWSLRLQSDDLFAQKELVNQKAWLNKTNSYSFVILENTSSDFNNEFNVKILASTENPFDFKETFFNNSSLGFSPEGTTKITVNFNQRNQKVLDKIKRELKQIEKNNLIKNNVSSSPLDNLNETEVTEAVENKNKPALFIASELNYGTKYEIKAVENNSIILNHTQTYSSLDIAESDEIFVHLANNEYSLLSDLPNSIKKNQWVGQTIEVYGELNNLLIKGKIIQNEKKRISFREESIGEVMFVDDSEIDFEKISDITEGTLSSSLDNLDLGDSLPDASIFKANQAVDIEIDPNEISNIDQEDLISSKDKFVLDLLEANYFLIKGTEFDEVTSFQKKNTSKVDDHYHSLELLGIDIVSSIDSIVLAGNEELRINLVDDIDYEIIQRPSKILKGAVVYFWNGANFGNEYTGIISDYGTNYINVEITNDILWDTVFNEKSISPSWSLQILSKDYGFTKDTFYKNFNVGSLKITNELNMGSDTVSVEDSSDLSVGDSIVIVSPRGYKETTIVSEIINVNIIKISSFVQNRYFIEDNPYIKVLKNSFSNNHTHIIKNGEVQNLSIETFRLLGYPRNHSHNITALIENVSSLESVNDNLLSMGNSPKIYATKNKGENWKEIVDLSYNKEDDFDLGNISSSLYDKSNNIIVVGTDKGFLFSNTSENQSIFPIN